ncbi:type VI secretion system baseplate subunit TssG, partial [Pseudomonas viridiflava]|uniref:type VI secretion system baseplate subunit TssG n=1 Tax=Pseudomonas viridiflava TaxID=33069 RepID=UPI003C7D2553
FQAVLLVVDRLRDAHPLLSEDDLYDQLESQANPSLGFPSSDVSRVEFFHEHGHLRARMQFNLIGLVGSGSPLPAFYGEQALGVAWAVSLFWFLWLASSGKDSRFFKILR